MGTNRCRPSGSNSRFGRLLSIKPSSLWKASHWADDETELVSWSASEGLFCGAEKTFERSCKSAAQRQQLSRVVGALSGYRE
jgi:hypothetical protein